MIINPMEWLYHEAPCENEMYDIAKEIVEKLGKEERAQYGNKVETNC